MTKVENISISKPQEDNGLAIISMVLGIVSLTGPGLLLGIPAIVTAIIALKNKRGGRNLSITGLATGIISTVVSLLFLTFMTVLIIWGVNHPDGADHYQNHLPPNQNDQRFDSSRT